MRTKLSALVPAALALSLILPALAPAHEFIVVPEEWQSYKAEQVVPLSIYSTHVFARSEELEDEGYSELSYQGHPLPLTANQNWLTYDSKVTLAGGGAALICGHRKPMLYNKVQYEKFAKLLLPVDGQSAGFDKVAGQRLEIVPMSDPFAVKPGDELRFKVLLDGKPAKFDAVWATYDGFSYQKDAWAYTAPPSAHGEATVKITKPGFWMVRTAVKLDEKGEGFDAVALRTVLAFPVR